MFCGKLFLAGLLGAVIVCAVPRANATPISPPATVLLSDIASSSPNTYSILVGDITYYFEGCSGNGCTSNAEVLGVPASASTGPGGGIIIQSVSGLANNVLVAPGFGNQGKANTSDITLFWTAVTAGNELVAATGAAVGGVGTPGPQSASGGGTTMTTYNYSTGNTVALPGVNMSTSGGPNTKPFPTAVNNVTGQTDITASGTGYLTDGSVFLSEVPEPASIVLLLSALGGLGYVRRRRVGVA